MTVGVCGDEVKAIEITYVDPVTGNICRRDAFCDPQQWAYRLQPRFLISADLVNLLVDEYRSRQERFSQLHDRLNACRLGYMCDLFRLRRAMEEIVSKMPDDTGYRLPPEGGEICPVHFFLPGKYIDAWTREHVAMATKKCKEALRAEIQELTTRVFEYGITSWQQLLDNILKRGMPLPAFAGNLAGMCENPEEHRSLVNYISSGLLDEFETLEVQVQEAERELADRDSRKPDVERAHRKLQREEEKLLETLGMVREKIRETEEKKAAEAAAAAAEEADKAARAAADSAKQQRLAEERNRQIEEAFQKKLAEQARKLADENAELEMLQQQLGEWQRRVATCDDAKLQQLREEAGVIGMKTRAVQRQCDGTEAASEQLRRTQEEMEARMEKDRLTMEKLQHDLDRLPPPDPRTFDRLRLQRELKKLMRVETELKKKLQGPLERIRAIRYQLRLLYKKLGWEWDLSDSDDDDIEDKPYWERRKLASTGLAKFNESQFLFAETEKQARRKKKKESKAKSQQAATLMRTITSKSLAGKTEASTAVSPFQHDGGTATSNLVGTHENVRPPGLTRDPSLPQLASRSNGQPPAAERATVRRNRSAQVRELHAAERDRLQHCASSLTEILPADSGRLGEARKRIMDALAEFSSTDNIEPSFPDDWAETISLDRLSTTLHGVVDEVASLEDQSHPICGTLRQSTQYVELKRHLEEACRLNQQHRRAEPNADGHRSGAEMSTSARWLDTGESTLPRPPTNKLPSGLRPPRGAPRSDPFSETLSGVAAWGGNREPDRPPLVDLGFRPDGVGEERLENWPRFVVTRTAFGSPSKQSRGDKPSTLLRDASTGALRLADSKVASFQKLAPDGDFRNYLSAQQRGDLSRSTSAPEVIRLGPSLPQLVTASSAAPRGGVSGSGTCAGATSGAVEGRVSPLRRSTRMRRQSTLAVAAAAAAMEKKS